VLFLFSLPLRHGNEDVDEDGNDTLSYDNDTLRYDNDDEPQMGVWPPLSRMRMLRSKGQKNLGLGERHNC